MIKNIKDLPTLSPTVDSALIPLLQNGVAKAVPLSVLNALKPKPAGELLRLPLGAATPENTVELTANPQVLLVSIAPRLASVFAVSPSAEGDKITVPPAPSTDAKWVIQA